MAAEGAAEGTGTGAGTRLERVRRRGPGGGVRALCYDLALVMLGSKCSGRAAICLDWCNVCQRRTRTGWRACRSEIKPPRLSNPINTLTHSLVNNAGMVRGREHIGGESRGAANNRQVAVPASIYAC